MTWVAPEYSRDALEKVSSDGYMRSSPPVDVNGPFKSPILATLPGPGQVKRQFLAAMSSDEKKRKMHFVISFLKR